MKICSTKLIGKMLIRKINNNAIGVIQYVV